MTKFEITFYQILIFSLAIRVYGFKEGLLTILLTAAITWLYLKIKTKLNWE